MQKGKGRAERRGEFARGVCLHEKKIGKRERERPILEPTRKR
ncbi:hypothetical protein FOCC_FOCC005518, partial [Frankliniella occidentalis]